MEFVGREREILVLQEALDRRSPSLVTVRGPGGSGVSRFLREALSSRPHVVVPVPHLPDESTRTLVLRTLLSAPAGGGGGSRPEAPDGVPDWPGILALATSHAPAPAPGSGAPFTLVLDNAHRLASVRSGVPALLRRFMADLGPRGIPFHLVLAGTDVGGMEDLAAGPPRDGVEPVLDIELRPLSPAETGRFFPRWSPMDRFTGWTILGGNPGRLRMVEPRSTLAATVQRLILDPDGLLHDAAPRALERTVQAPARYGAILEALAGGAHTWGGIAAAVPDLEGSAGLGPYLKTLQARGIVEMAVSLDARPGSRARRYDLADPFLRFWYGEVQPHLGLLATRGSAHLWEDRIRGRLPAHAAALLPRAARLWLENEATAVLGAVARETGGLWDPSYSLDVAGVLRNGEVVYGLCRWGDTPLGETDLDQLERRMRRTRFGIAREGRHRVLMGRGEITDGLRSRVARDPMVHVVGVRELVGVR